jgi:hypothetical protein
MGTSDFCCRCHISLDLSILLVLILIHCIVTTADENELHRIVVIQAGIVQIGLGAVGKTNTKWGGRMEQYAGK